jgi:hypothetical protein
MKLGFRQPIPAGQKFERLTVLGPSGKDKNGKTLYFCYCSCGNYTEIRGADIKNGATRSCGCYNIHRCAERLRLHMQKAVNARRKFVGDISGEFWSHIVRNAATRDIPLQVTKEDAWEQFKKQKGKCAPTGTVLKLNPLAKFRGQNTASLDRINSSKAYTKMNIQWLHKDVNMMKRHLSNEEFVEICRQVVTHDLSRNA